MISVMIIEDAYSTDDYCSLFKGIYIPLVISLLRSKGVSCEAVRLKGFEKMYSFLGKSKENIIYVPRLETSESLLSFIFADSVSSVSTSFKIASIIRKLRVEKGLEQVVFIEQIKDNDLLKSNSPLLVDNIRLKPKCENEFYDFAMNCAESVAEAIYKYYNY